MTVIERAIDGFQLSFGHPPEGVVFVPGRVNLIGEHVDYNDGLVLPMPIAAGTAVAWSSRDEIGVEAVALDLEAVRDRFKPAIAAPHHPVDWRSYLRGTSAGLIERGYALAGTRLAIAGSIPRGSGLSSSASLCVAAGRALLAAAGVSEIDPRALALAAQAAEHRWAGVRCGIMDQMAVAAGEAGHALLLDCADMTSRQVRLPAGWSVMIVQSGVRRGLVDGQYNQRRRDCEAAASLLGVPSLRHATADNLSGARLDPVVERRARHVVEEISRVGQAVGAIEGGDLETLGRIMRASHASLRDLFEVSEAHVDRLVEVLDEAIGTNGGARMTGGGFGGAVVAVLPASDVPRVQAEVKAHYAPPSFAPLEIMVENVGHAMAGVDE